MRWRMTLPLLCLLAVPAVAQAQPAPLPAAVPAGVIAVIAFHVAAELYTYGGDCQQVTAAQTGDVCSLTTAQSDGSWLVQLYSVFVAEPLGQYPIEQFTVTPDQVAAAGAATPTGP